MKSLLSLSRIAVLSLIIYNLSEVKSQSYLSFFEDSYVAKLNYMELTTFSESPFKNYAFLSKHSLTPFDILTDEKPVIEFVGSGEVQKSISQGTDIPVTTGMGVTYRKEFDPDNSHLNTKLFEFEVIINIASTSDSLVAIFNNGIISNSTAFGAYISTPNNSKQSARITSRIYTEDGVGILDGFEGGVYMNNRTWVINDSTALNGGALNFKLGFFADIIPYEYLENYSIRLGVIPIGIKSLLGDLTLDINEDARKEILNSKQTLFYSPEIYMVLRLKNVEASFSLPFTWSAAEIPGLSRFQFITTIGFTGGFSLNLEKD